MPPSGLRSMALRRQLLASFLVEYSSESGPAPFEKNVLLRLHMRFSAKLVVRDSFVPSL